MTTTPPISRDEFDRIFQTKSDDLRQWRESLRADNQKHNHEPGPECDETCGHDSQTEEEHTYQAGFDDGWAAACDFIADYFRCRLEDGHTKTTNIQAKDWILKKVKNHPELGYEKPATQTN